jgi:hypothetical protein
MYNKEKAKENYIKNRDKLNEKAKQYYHDHKEERKKYNSKYWEEHKHKYSEQRKQDVEYKDKQKEYYEIYKNKPKVNIHHSKIYKNKKLTMILNNHKPQLLTLNHTLYFD